MDIPEKLWESGILAGSLFVVIVAMLKYGLPHLINQIEREREVSNERSKAERSAHMTELEALEASRTTQIQTITDEWRQTRNWLDQKSDSWKQGLEKLDESVCRQTKVIQEEMLRNRDLIPKEMVDRAEKKLEKLQRPVENKGS